MKIWHIGYGYGDLVTMAETVEEAKAKFLKKYPTLRKPYPDPDNRFKDNHPQINDTEEQKNDVEYYGE